MSVQDDPEPRQRGGNARCCSVLVATFAICLALLFLLAYVEAGGAGEMFFLLLVFLGGVGVAIHMLD